MLRTIPYPPPRTMFNNGDSSHFPNRHHNQQIPEVHVQPSAPPEKNSAAVIASRTYKTCTNLFLTRRLSDALAGLQPLVEGPPGAMSQLPRPLRIKLWSLYLAILDAALKMTASEGKAMWGQKEWPLLVGKIRSGAIWDSANRAYGDEGRVDLEVVITLSTLLLSHAPDQSITQKRIEAYLGAMPSPLQDEDPKSISQRAKITEIYILHVLPRVGEWEYAREFAQFSPDIDEEQKEMFYAQLDALKKDKEEAELHSQELEQQREYELEQQREEVFEYERKLAEDKEKARIATAAARSVSRARSSSARPRSRAESRGGDPAAALKPKKTAITKDTKKATPNVVARKATGKGKHGSSLINSTSTMLGRLQEHIAKPVGYSNLLRTVIMLVMIAWMSSNKRIRDRVRRLLVIAWIKMTRTIGMGMKVTYV